MVSVTLTYDEKIEQWGAWIEGIGAYGQGANPQGAIDDLKTALLLYIEEMGRDRFEQQLSPPSQTLSLPLDLLVPSA